MCLSRFSVKLHIWRIQSQRGCQTWRFVDLKKHFNKACLKQIAEQIIWILEHFWFPAIQFIVKS